MSFPAPRALYIPDVLCAIFDECIKCQLLFSVYPIDYIRQRQKTLKIALNISAVCKMWRLTGLNMGKLWTALPSVNLPLKGDEETNTRFADHIMNLLQRSSRTRGVAFDIQMHAGIHSSSCHRIMDSLFRRLQDWRTVSITFHDSNTFQAFVHIPQNLTRLISLSLVFRFRPDDLHCDISQLLQRTEQLETLHIQNIEAVDTNAWRHTPRRHLKVLLLSSQKLTQIQEIAVQQIPITEVHILILSSRNNCPATIVRGMVTNTPHNVIEDLSLITKDSRKFRAGSICPMLRSLPSISSLEMTLPPLVDILEMDDDMLAPSLNSVMFNVDCALKDRQQARRYGSALRALGQMDKFNVVLTDIKPSTKIKEDLEGWEETASSEILATAASKLHDMHRRDPEHLNKMMNILLEIQCMEGLSFSDLVGSTIDKKLYMILKDIKSGNAAPEYLTVIMEIIDKWTGILQSGITCWDTAGKPDDEYTLFYEPIPYVANAVEYISD